MAVTGDSRGMVLPAAKTPLILLHGALGSAGQLAPLATRLRGQFDVHALDFPGHGDESLGDRPFSMACFVASLREHIQQQQLIRPVLFGHSMGGVVALLLALEQPRTLGRVITLGTKLEWTPEVASSEVAFLDPDKIEHKVPAFARTLEQRHQTLAWRRLVQLTRDLTVELGDQPPLSRAQLRQIAVPVFHGVAERDHLVAREEAQRVVKDLPQGQFWSVAGAHPLESVGVDELAAQVGHFAASVGGAVPGRRDV